MDRRPLIGVTVSATTIPISGEPLEIGYVPRVYDEAILAAGGLPVHIPTLAGAELLSRLDGIVLSGGGDVDPAVYGEANTAARYVEPERDVAEREIVHRALADEIPLLGVCRGAQILNVALGGTLVQEHPGHHFQHVPLEGPTHPVFVAPGSRLEMVFGTGQVDVNSVHHQAIATLGQGLAVTARAADGTVEAIELADPGVWVLAVQWHPEAMLAPQRPLFAALVERAQRTSQPPSTTSVEPVM